MEAWHNAPPKYATEFTYGRFGPALTKKEFQKMAPKTIAVLYCIARFIRGAFKKYAEFFRDKSASKKKRILAC